MIGHPAHPRVWMTAMWLGLSLLLPFSCTPTVTVNPFAEAPQVELDGTAMELNGNLLALGELEADETLRVTVDGDGIEVAMLLRQDAGAGTTATIVDGFRNGSDAAVLAPADAGNYFLFLPFEENRAAVSVAVELADTSRARSAGQAVRVEFDPGYLSDPGLFDPVDGTTDEQEFLASIEELVSGQIIERLQEIFDGTAIAVIEADDDAGAMPVSTLRFVADRVVVVEGAVNDIALPPPDPEIAACQELVIFGEVLPRGTRPDLGNRVSDDEAVVYVGSFQGRGNTCQTAVINSVNNIVMALSQTGAHEIGHLVGLDHVEQVDLMNRGATLANFRELAFARGQWQTDDIVGDEIVTELFTGVVQDPAVYLENIFQQSAP